MAMEKAKGRKTFKAIVAFAFAAALAGCLAACGGSNDTVAATVDGHDIMESEVTKTIEDMRTSYGATDQDTWGQMLASYGMTPEQMREQCINQLAVDYLVAQAAKSEFGIEVTDAMVDEKVAEMRNMYDSDEAWAEALKSVNMTEAEYKDVVRKGLVPMEARNKFVDQATVSDEDTASMVQAYVDHYDGSKRSSHILFKAEDKATAEDVLAKLKSNEITFEDAAKQYSNDNSANAGGDVGWDKDTKFVDAYQQALDGLDNGQMSDLVESEYGIHIIKCTDVYRAPEDHSTVKLSDFPSDWQSSIQSTLESSAVDKLYNEWVDKLKENMQLDIKPMPEGLPYSVDMSKYQASSEASNAANMVQVDENGNPVSTSSSDAATSESSESSASSTSADSGSSAGN